MIRIRTIHLRQAALTTIFLIHKHKEMRLLNVISDMNGSNCGFLFMQKVTDKLEQASEKQITLMIDCLLAKGFIKFELDPFSDPADRASCFLFITDIGRNYLHQYKMAKKLNLPSSGQASL